MYFNTLALIACLSFGTASFAQGPNLRAREILERTAEAYDLQAREALAEANEYNLRARSIRARATRGHAATSPNHRGVRKIPFHDVDYC
jgi:hypothetical protein